MHFGWLAESSELINVFQKLVEFISVQVGVRQGRLTGQISLELSTPPEPVKHLMRKCHKDRLPWSAPHCLCQSVHVK